MNASNSSIAGVMGSSATADAPADATTPPGTPGISQPEAGLGGALGTGVTYPLDGKGLEAHAGERVEIRGVLMSSDNGRDKKSRRNQYPDRARLVVKSIRTIAKPC
jgi:hypothetical protein